MAGCKAGKLSCIVSAQTRLVASALAEISRATAHHEAELERAPAAGNPAWREHRKAHEERYRITIAPNGCRLAHWNAGEWQSLLTTADPLDALTAAGEHAADDALRVLRRLPDGLQITFEHQTEPLPKPPFPFARALRGEVTADGLRFRRTSQHTFRTMEAKA